MKNEEIIKEDQRQVIFSPEDADEYVVLHRLMQKAREEERERILNKFSNAMEGNYYSKRGKYQANVIVTIVEELIEKLKKVKHDGK